MLNIRDATTKDAAAIVRFWNPVIRDSAATFASAPKSVADVAAMIKARRDAGRCFLVAQSDGQVVGFATYDQFRKGDGYAHTMESTVILAPDVRGQGTARKLMRKLEDHARNAGIHSIIAGISGDNPQAIGFHLAIGYHDAGKIREAGRKFERWMDLHLLQKIL